MVSRMSTLEIFVKGERGLSEKMDEGFKKVADDIASSTQRLQGCQDEVSELTDRLKAVEKRLERTGGLVGYSPAPGYRSPADLRRSGESNDSVKTSAIPEKSPAPEVLASPPRVLSHAGITGIPLMMESAALSVTAAGSAMKCQTAVGSAVVAGKVNVGCIRQNTRGSIHSTVLPGDAAPRAADTARWVVGSLLVAWRSEGRRRRGLAARVMNEQQREAAEAPGGAHLVIAGAGSGKTKTLTERLAYLVATEEVSPHRIVLLTFTRRAAEEMKSRAESLVGAQIQNVRSGTFHSFSLNLLKKYRARMGFLSGFSVLDAADTEAMIAQMRKRLGLAGRSKRFPSVKDLMKLFGKSVNTGTPLELLLEDEEEKFRPFSQGIIEVREAFEEEKQRQSCLDFDDLLLNCQQLLEEDETVRKEEAGRCEHILVDEYQDTNHLQASIVKRLSSVHGNVLAVGDDAQSIYGFRGASVENIWDFPKMYSSCSQFILEDNYRSTQQILNLANAVLSVSTKHCRSLVGIACKSLRSNIAPGPLPQLLYFGDEWKEALWVADKIEQLLEQGVAPKNIAVLYRKNKTSKKLALQLLRRRLDHRIYGGQKLTSRAHFKDFMAAIFIALNPLDEIHWKRLLCLFTGVGDMTARKVVNQVKSKDPPQLDAEVWAQKKFYPDLSKLQGLLSLLSKTSDPRTCVRHAREWYRVYLKENYPEDFDDRMEDLQMLEDYAASCDSLEDMANSLQLDQSVLEKGRARNESGDTLTLSTVHSAKGLEWDVVFVMGMGHMEWKRQDTEEAAEEGRRVLYVSLTRAKTNLYLTVPNPHLTSLLKDVPDLDKLVRTYPEVKPRLSLHTQRSVGNRPRVASEARPRRVSHRPSVTSLAAG
ncbi:pcrA [Symbiodinium microadriaticum]|nr:pcrA [Symbiodinium microadriaticum]